MGLADNEEHGKVGLGRQDWHACAAAVLLTNHRQTCWSFYSEEQEALRIYTDAFSAVAGVS